MAMSKRPDRPAKRRCAQAGCRLFHPCPKHPWGWAGYQGDLPANWKALVAETRRDYNGKCAKCGVYCPDDGFCDHIINRARGGGHERSNRQWLCKSCHDRKTWKESQFGRRRRKD